jgi:hypothetical protein
MPRKDGEKTNRQNKRDSKKKGGSGPYSSKHIRIQESLQQNKGSFKDESNVLKKN